MRWVISVLVVSIVNTAEIFVWDVVVMRYIDAMNKSGQNYLFRTPSTQQLALLLHAEIMENK